MPDDNQTRLLIREYRDFLALAWVRLRQAETPEEERAIRSVMDDSLANIGALEAKLSKYDAQFSFS